MLSVSQAIVSLTLTISPPAAPAVGGATRDLGEVTWALWESGRLGPEGLA